MSQYLRNLAKTAFEERAEDAIQTGSKLRSRVREAMNVVGDTKRFSVFGIVPSTTRGSSEEVVPAGIANAKPMAHLTESESFDYLDRADDAMTDVDAMRGYGYTTGKAVARSFDAKILAVLGAYNSEAYSHEGSVTGLRQVTTGGGLTAAKWGEAVAMLMDYDYEIDQEELTLVYPGLKFTDIVAEDKFIDRDYLAAVGRETMRTGMTVPEILGALPIPIGNAGREHGGGAMPADKAYLFAKSAVGLATSTFENSAVVEWVPERRSWLIGAECLAGATRIQNAGIIEINLA